MAGKIEQTERAITNSVAQAEKALTALDDVTEGGEVAGGLPEGWTITKLDEICSKVTDGSHNPPKDKGVGYLMLSAKNVQKGKIDFSAGGRFINEVEFEKENSRTKIKTDDLLLTIVGALGRTALVPENFQPFTLQRSVAVLSAPKVVANFFKYSFDQPGIQSYIFNNAQGTAQKGIYLKKLRELEIPLPPLAEQTVIAQTLDTLLAQMDNIKTRLDAIPNILKTFRQSVLAAAVSGKLTEEWRGENECEEWIELTLNDVVIFQNGFAFKSGWFQSEGKYQVLKLGNIRDRKLLLENSPAFVTEEIAQEYIKFKVKADDSLISMTGTRHKMDYGYASFVDNPMNLLINQRVGRISPIKEKVSGLYLNTFLRSEIFRKQFFKGETGGVNQGNVGTKHILSCSMKLPPIKEQTEIVNRVEELFAFADQIEQQVKNAQDRVNNLTQSILAKAFRGELTAQWRAENPDLIMGENSAAALLAKIQEERDALTQKAKPKKKSTAKKTKKKVAEK